MEHPSFAGPDGVERWYDERLRAEGLIARGRGVRTGVHQHRSWQIGIAIEGSLRVRIGAHDVHLEPGHVLCVAPCQPHEVFPGARRRVYAQIELPAELLPARASILVITDRARGGVVRDVIAASHAGAPGRESRVARLRHALARSVPATWPAEHDEAIGRALAHLEQHVDRNVSIAELVELTGLPRTTFMRRFRAHAGVAPHQLQRARRLALALDRIDAGATLAQASRAAGFYDQAHFTNVARRLLGEPPGRWRKRRRVG